MAALKANKKKISHIKPQQDKHPAHQINQSKTKLEGAPKEKTHKMDANSHPER
jgi:hypothetical protein